MKTIVPAKYIFGCDRCEAKVETDRESPPDGWATFIDMISGMDWKTVTLLCEPCAETVRAAIKVKGKTMLR